MEYFFIYTLNWVLYGKYAGNRFVALFKINLNKNTR